MTMKKPEPTAEAEAARELVRRAGEQGLSLTGPDGLLKQLTKTVLETALNGEMTEHLGHDRHGESASGEHPQRDPGEDGAHRGHRAGRDRRAAGPGGYLHPADRAEAAAATDRSHEVVLSLYGKGLTTGEISAHFAEICGASVSKETISRITDRVIEEMHHWAARPLEEIYAAIFLDAIVVEVRDGQVANRPVYAAIGVSLDGEKDVLGLWAGTGGRARSSG